MISIEDNPNYIPTARARKLIIKIAWGIYRELKNYNAHWSDCGAFRRDFSQILAHWSYMPEWAQQECFRIDLQAGYKHRTFTGHFLIAMYRRKSGTKLPIDLLMQDIAEIPF